MKRHTTRRRIAIGITLAVVCAAVVAPWVRGADGAGPQGSVLTTDNESGTARTISVTGSPVVADSNPFFQDLGVNGRRCVTCHQLAENMTVSAAGVRARFDATDGMDPIFRTNDGSNSPLADVSTVEARRAAYSLLLNKGVIRVGLAIPANAEFELVAVSDPAGYAGNNANGDELSLFRRPLPATNLAFLSAVMWDGRETLQRGSARLSRRHALRSHAPGQQRGAGARGGAGGARQRHPRGDLRVRDGVVHRADFRSKGRGTHRQWRAGWARGAVDTSVHVWRE